MSIHLWRNCICQTLYTNSTQTGNTHTNTYDTNWSHVTFWCNTLSLCIIATAPQGQTANKSHLVRSINRTGQNQVLRQFTHLRSVYRSSLLTWQQQFCIICSILHWKEEQPIQMNDWFMQQFSPTQSSPCRSRLQHRDGITADRSPCFPAFAGK